MFLKTVLFFDVGTESFEYRCLLEEDVNSTYVDGLNSENKYLTNIPSKATEVDPKNWTVA